LRAARLESRAKSRRSAPAWRCAYVSSMRTIGTLSSYSTPKTQCVSSRSARAISSTGARRQSLTFAREAERTLASRSSELGRCAAAQARLWHALGHGTRFAARIRARR
jgi:hypothetical protein